MIRDLEGGRWVEFGAGAFAFPPGSLLATETPIIIIRLDQVYYLWRSNIKFYHHLNPRPRCV